MKIYYPGGFLDIDLTSVQTQEVSRGFQSGTSYSVRISDKYTIECKDKEEALRIAHQLTSAIRNNLDTVEIS